MLADYFTTSLQGKAFGVYRDVVMGYKHDSSLKELTLSRIKEHVENRNVSIQEEVIPEGTNANKDGNNAKHTCERQVEEFSKQVNVETKSYKDALVRLN